MPCREFEERLLDYGKLEPGLRERVEQHLGSCSECRAFLHALGEIDAALGLAAARLQTPPELIERVHLRVRQELPELKPSWLPEILDLIGWSAAAGAVFLIQTVLPVPLSESLVLWSAAPALFASGLLASLAALRDRER